MDKVLFKLLALSLGGAIGGATGSVLSVISVALNTDHLPMVAAVAMIAGTAIGVLISAAKMRVHRTA